MVVRDDLRTTREPSIQRAVLKHCENVLRQRVAEDAAFAWLWELKLKVAHYGLKMLEGQARATADVEATGPRIDEIQELAQGHPLLKNQRTTPSSEESREETNWYRDLQDRVQRLARGWS